MSERPNFYRLLRLDPTVQNDADIKKRIEELKQKYSRVRTDAPTAQQREAEAFEIFLGQVGVKQADTIYYVMFDPILRSVEAQARQKEMVEEERQLRGMLRVLQKRGSYTRQDVDVILKSLPTYEEQIILSRIGDLKIPEFSVPTKSKQTVEPVLSDAEAFGVDADLRGLHLSSLYQFLGPQCGPRSSPQALQAEYDSQRRALEKLIRGSAAHKVRNAILARVKKYLLEPDNRRKYDNYLAQRGMRKLDASIQLAGGPAKRIDQQGLDSIVREARIPGVTSEQVREYVKQWAERTKGWTFAIGTDAAAWRFPTCGFCEALADAIDQDKCHRCGQPLRFPCPNPNCTQIVASEDTHCRSCGCTTGDKRHVDNLMASANSRVKEGRFLEARECVDRVLSVWRDYLEATVLRGQIEAGLAKQADQRRHLEQLVHQRRFLEAQRLAAELSRSGQEVDAATLQQIEEEVRLGREQYQEANKLMRSGQVELAVQSHIKALSHCGDLAEAEAAIESCPPPPPGSLRVTLSSLTTTFRWKRAGIRPGIVYHVLRKCGSIPAGLDDGEERGRVNGEQFADATATDGRVYYYAVFSVWRGMPSATAAVSEGVLFPAPVSDLSATSADGRVDVTWKLPTGCSVVEISRVPGGAIGKIRGEEFADTGLRVGMSLAYEVVALYPDPNVQGRLLRSTSETVKVSVTRRPKAVTDFQAFVEGTQVRMVWTRPQVGTVEVLQCDRKPDDELVGALLESALVRRIGQPVNRLTAESAVTELPASGQLFLVPITVEGTTAIVGRWAHVANLPEVGSLRCRRLMKGQVRLSWDWPAGIDTVHITLQATSTETRGTSLLEHSEEVSRREYQQLGGFWLVHYAQPLTYRITVATKSTHGGFYSAGTELIESLGLETRVTYRICAKNWLLRRRQPSIQLLADGPDVRALDEIVVVGRPDRMPTHVQDGEILQEVERIVFSNRCGELPLPFQPRATPLYVRLFLRHPDRQPHVRLLPVAKEKLRLEP